MRRERGATARFGPDRQPPAMSGQDVLDDREAQPGPLMLTAYLRIDTIKAFGNARNMLGGNSRPEIRHRHVDLGLGSRRTLLDGNDNLSALAAIFAGIFDKVCAAPGVTFFARPRYSRLFLYRSMYPP